MATIISIEFLSNPITLVSSVSLIIKPEMEISIDQSGEKVDLEFTIETPGVDLIVANPEQDYNPKIGISEFYKEIIFEKTGVGEKKDFTLKVYAKTGNSSQSDMTYINYL